MAVLIKHNNRLVKKGNMLITGKGIVLPANTLRFRLSRNDTSPTSISNGGTWTRVEDSEYNDWDWTCNDTDWSYMFMTKLITEIDPNIKIIAAGDTSSVTNMKNMFSQNDALTSVALFDTSNVTNMEKMFYYNRALTSVPLFDVSNVTNMQGMFNACLKVESGALALYQRASATGKVTDHALTFNNCGKDTTTGLAELNQIPADWGGLAAG